MADFIIKIIIPLICTILTMYIIPFLKEKRIYHCVTTAVQAAEQIYQESGMGEEKFEYVMEWVQKKFRISEEDLTNIIEAAVFEMNGGKSNGSDT